MKKLMKLGSLVAFLFVIGLAFSSFTSSDTEAQNNGVEVTIIKDQGNWIWICDDFSTIIYPTSSTDQYKNGVLHMSTYVFDIPEDCTPAPKKTQRGTVLGYEGEARYIFNPSGKAILKEINNN